MKKKLDLSLERLAVDSFAAGGAERRDAGTVHAAERPCTSWNTCQCPTSAYVCSTRPATAISCPQTSLC
ncbi:MAG TPA: hypothetical protein VF092_03540 [Longimicrobium sp.]